MRFCSPLYGDLSSQRWSFFRVLFLKHSNLMHCKIFTVAAVSHSHSTSLVNCCCCCIHPIYTMMLLTFVIIFSLLPSSIATGVCFMSHIATVAFMPHITALAVVGHAKSHSSGCLKQISVLSCRGFERRNSLGRFFSWYLTPPDEAWLLRFSTHAFHFNALK